MIKNVHKPLFFGLYLSILSVNAQTTLPNTISETDKLFGLSKFWQEVNYNFIYLNKIGHDKWDDYYKTFIPLVTKTTNDYEYYKILQQFCALLKDGHTNIYFPASIQEMNTMFGEYRIFLQNINNKAIVIRTNASKKNEIPVGSEIIEVNDLATHDYIQKFVSPFISSSTDFVRQDWSVSKLFTGLEGTFYKVKIKKPTGKIFELTLTHQTTTEQEVYPAFETQNTLLEFKWVKKDIAYLALNSFENPTIDSLLIQKLPELLKAKGLILDLRKNGGGNSWIAVNILKYFTNDSILFGTRSITKINNPTLRAWGKGLSLEDTSYSPLAKNAYLAYNDQLYHAFEFVGDTVKVNGKRIIVPTVILTGHSTASSAEDFLIYASNQTHMIKMGQPTFGSTGQPIFFELPGGGSARICTLKSTYPDGREFVGTGILPDIEVSPTLQDILNNYDVTLNKAVEFLKAKLK